MAADHDPADFTATVGICTFRRNDQLDALLVRIDELAPGEVPNGRVGVVVVDDSPEAGARATVQSRADALAITVRYVHSGSGDIATARNLVLVESMSARFVACLDDDCVPQPGWLRHLLEVAEDCSADIVVGHREFTAAAGAPSWLRDQPFLAENALYPDRSDPAIGNTANVLIRSSWLATSGVRFRADLGQVGGEDMVFFTDARRAGAVVRYAAGSVSLEPCDGRRATFGYQLWRQIWLGNNEAIINATTREVPRWRILARGAKRCVVSAVRPFLDIATRRPPQWRWAVASSAHGVGTMLGVAGVRLRHRS